MCVLSLAGAIVAQDVSYRHTADSSASDRLDRRSEFGRVSVCGPLGTTKVRVDKTEPPLPPRCCVSVSSSLSLFGSPYMVDICNNADDNENNTRKLNRITNSSNKNVRQRKTHNENENNVPTKRHESTNTNKRSIHIHKYGKYYEPL